MLITQEVKEIIKEFENVFEKTKKLGGHIYKHGNNIEICVHAFNGIDEYTLGIYDFGNNDKAYTIYTNIDFVHTNFTLRAKLEGSWCLLKNCTTDMFGNFGGWKVNDIQEYKDKLKLWEKLTNMFLTHPEMNW